MKSTRKLLYLLLIPLFTMTAGYIYMNLKKLSMEYIELRSKVIRSYIMLYFIVCILKIGRYEKSNKFLYNVIL